MSLLCLVGTVRAEDNVSFRHYDVEDGLSQNVVTYIMQDHQGFMWFGTWDGLNRFDGYTFTAYKSHPGDASEMATNRIDYIYEDQLGYIWFQTYDGHTHRFDPKTEKFYSLPEFTEGVSFRYHPERLIEVDPGHLYFVTPHGFAEIRTDENGTVSVNEFTSKTSGQLASGHVSFLLDAGKHVWVGTDKDLCQLDSNNHITHYKPERIAAQNNFTCGSQCENDLWFGTQGGQIWRYRYSKLNFEKITLPCSSAITAVQQVDKRTVLATSEADGFYVIDLLTMQVNHHHMASNADIKSNNFLHIYSDTHGLVWLENKQPGIFRYRLADGNLKHFENKIEGVNAYSIQYNPIFFEDANGKLWINPYQSGFCSYNRETDELEPFYYSPNGLAMFNSNLIHTAYAGRDGVLWLSTYNNGLEKIAVRKTTFRFFPITDSDGLADNQVRSIAQLKSGDIVVGTKDGTTRFYDVNFNYRGTLGADGSVLKDQPNPLSHMVYSICEDSDHDLWIGSKGGGLYQLKPQGDGYAVKRYQHSDDPQSLSNNDIYKVLVGADGMVYIGTYGGGLNILNPKTGRFTHAHNTLKDYPLEACAKVRDLCFDRQNRLWVATTNGLLQMNQKAGGYQYYYNQRTPNDIHSLSNNDVYKLCLDRKGELWIATFGGGLCHLLEAADETHPARFEAYTMSQGLRSDIVLCIVEDGQGKLWMTGENSISSLSVDRKTIDNFRVFNRHWGTYFMEASGTRLTMDRIVFGGSSGCYFFDPIRLERSSAQPNLCFTRLYVNNKEMHPGMDNSPLENGIGFTEKLRLRYNQSSFAIEFSAIDLEDPENIQYAYMLEGFDKEWNYIINQNRATYTRLPHGRYTLHVKSTNHDGVWVDNERTIRIIVKAAPWMSWWAICLYLLVLVGIYMGYRRFRAEKLSSVVLEQRVQGLLEQQQQMQEYYRKKMMEPRPKDVPKKQSPEELFLDKLMEVMEKNMSNSNLTVDDLVSEMALGRTVFFNRLKSITGLSPVEFIREMRLKRAAQLLESPNYTIAEVTYMIGMSDSRYFSKCFKASFGMTPSEYRKQKKG